MGRTPENCDGELLSRFTDGEVSDRERRIVTAHLEKCSDCRRALAEHRRFSSLLQSGVEKGVAEIDFQEVETRLQTYRRGERKIRAGGPPVRRLPLLPAGLFSSKRMYVPALAAAAAVALFVLTLFGRPAPETRPSAIVKSFQGPVQSVMILQTPESHETILWFSESDMTEEAGPAEDDTLGHRLSSWIKQA